MPIRHLLRQHRGQQERGLVRSLVSRHGQEVRVVPLSAMALILPAVRAPQVIRGYLRSMISIWEPPDRLQLPSPMRALSVAGFRAIMAVRSYPVGFLYSSMLERL